MGERVGGKGSRLRTAGPWKRAELALGREAVCAGRGMVGSGGEGFVLLASCPLTLSSQVSEASTGPRRLHSLSISSDTTADSFSSLNPEEVGARLGRGDHFSRTARLVFRHKTGPRNPSSDPIHVTLAAASPRSFLPCQHVLDSL